MTRFVRKDRRIYEHSLCKVCGVSGMTGPSGCATAICLFCETPQCSSNGGGDGTCGVCFHGFLPGWSGSGPGQSCKYKGCTEPAVGLFPRKGRCCKTHALHILGANFLEGVFERRAKYWEPVEVPR